MFNVKHSIENRGEVLVRQCSVHRKLRQYKNEMGIERNIFYMERSMTVDSAFCSGMILEALFGVMKEES